MLNFLKLLSNDTHEDDSFDTSKNISHFSTNKYSSSTNSSFNSNRPNNLSKHNHTNNHYTTSEIESSRNLTAQLIKMENNGFIIFTQKNNIKKFIKYNYTN